MQLTHKERVLNLISGKNIDRLPSDIWVSDWAEAKIIRELNIGKDELIKILDNHFVMVCGLDNHKTWENKDSLDLALKYNYFRQNRKKNVIYDNWGVGWDIGHEGICDIYHPLSESTDLRNFNFPDFKDAHLLDFAKLVKEKYDGEYCIAGMQDLTIWERAYTLRGIHNVLIDIKLNRAFIEELFDRITEYQIGLAKRFVSLGVDLGFTGGDYGTQEDLMISLEDWKHFIMPRLKKIWDVYKSANIPVMHHSCGNIMKVIPYLIEMGLDILNPIQHVMSPEILRREFGKDIIFFGGIDSQGLIPFGTPEQIRKEVKKYVEILGKGRGYIIGPDQSIMSDTPIENTLALADAIKKYSYGTV